MRVMPIRYTDDVAASVAFYRALGLELGAVSRPGKWAELSGRGGVLAIHVAAADCEERCELAFEAEEPLEAVVARLRAAGFPGGEIVDQNFGRSLTVTDPDGVAVQINEQDRTLYT